jgi:hypothetical protein
VRNPTPAEVDLGPGPRLLVLADEFGAVQVARWCSDLLLRRAKYDDPDLPSLVWLGGRHAERLLALPELGVHEYWPRVWAARGLLHVWAPLAAPALLAAASDEAWRVRELAAKVAARWEVGEAAAALVGLVTDEVDRVRVAAVRALGRIGEAEDAELIRAVSSQPALSVAAERALDELSRRLDREL